MTSRTTRRKLRSTAADTFADETVRRAWRAALDLWGVTTNLSPPRPFQRKGPKWRADEPLAYIDLAIRQVVVNYELLAELGAADSLEAVLAHEVGHHVRFPHSLGLVAELHTMEQRLIPLLGASLTNLFFDLQVNEVVGRTHAEALMAVYRGFLTRGPVAPLFYFYLAIYEELWGRPPGDLAPPSMAAAMEHDFPGCRADARVFAQTFYALDDTRLQFIYFIGRFIRYVPDPEKLVIVFPLANDIPGPGQDDYDRAACGSDAMERALDEARRREWISETERARAHDETASDKVRHVATTPGTAKIPFRTLQASIEYKRLVDRYLIEPPPVAMPPEPSIPSLLEDWQPGDDARAIDWTASVLHGGAAAAAAPLKRELLADEIPTRERGLPAMEIYLDTSGSMPGPGKTVNAMTLAAQVLSASVLRKQGRVRGIIYSSEWILSDWLYAEEAARLFFLNYSGGGTTFPFPLLRTLARERTDIVRVVISDADFLWNVQYGDPNEVHALIEKKNEGRPGPRPFNALEYGVRRSQLFVMMLHIPARWRSNLKMLDGVLKLRQARLVLVDDPAELAAAARDLAKAILD